MPSGIIMQSSSVGATQEAIEKVLAANGYETSKPEPEKAAEAPKREDFPSQEAYAKAHDEFLDKGKTPTVAAEVAEPSEPKREDFDSDEAFEEAQEEFEAKQEEREERRGQEEENKRLAALPKKTRRQKAVEKATRELAEKNRKLEERLAALEGKAAKPAAEAEQPKVEAPKAPKREDFKTDAEYDDALFDYRYQMRRAKEEQEAARKRQEEGQARLQERLEKNFIDYKSEVLNFKLDHDDFDDVVNAVTGNRLSEPVYYAIVDLGKEGPPVTYYLGQHPEELDKLAELTPYRAAIEVGRLADRLKNRGKNGAPETPKKPMPKSNPEPVRPLSTSATSSTLTSRDAARNRDFKAFKAAQRRGA